MTKRLIVALSLVAVVFSANAFAEEATKAPAVKQAKPVKQARVVEQRIHESDMTKLEHMISKAVIAKQGSGSWEYTAKRMKPPKNEKWEGRWNEMGAEGWEAVDHFDNVYIFKRPSFASATKTAPVEGAVEKKSDAKAEKQKAKAEEKAQKDADKAAKKAQKEADKAAKQAEKDAKKAAKDAAKKKVTE